MDATPQSEVEILRRRVAELEHQLATQSVARTASMPVAEPSSLLATIVESSDEVMISKDLNGIIQSWNKAAERIFGYTAEEVIGRPITLLSVPGREEEIPHILDRIRRGERVDPYETERRTKDGRVLMISLSVSPIRDAAGTIIGASKVARNITEWKRTEEALRESENRFSLAFAQAPIGMVLCTPEGRITEVNQAYLNMLGYTREELALHDSAHFTHQDDIELTRQFFVSLQQGSQSGASLEKRYLRKDGQILWARASATMRRDHQGRAVQLIAIIEDVTERKRLEQALQDSEERLRQVFAQAPVAIIVFRGRDFRVELANPSYQAFLPGRELVGRRFADAVPELEPQVWEAFYRVLDSGEPFIANEWPITYDQDKDGVAEEHWFNVAYHPLRNPAGVVTGMVAVCSEVTVQLRARQEVERVNRELEEFAYVASHDLQEPLRMVNLYTQKILKRLATDDPMLNDYADFVRQGVLRMERLIRDLLTYSRTVQRDELRVGHADLFHSLTEALLVVKNSIEDTGAVVTSQPLPIVRGDTQQLSHVFQNLLSNAVKYRRREGPPEIHISVEADGTQWIVAVRDNGIGFDPQHASRIFGLFKRLHKEEYPGTGVGLAICQRIVERYGGRMWAEGRPGEGATFYFSLPQADRP